MSQSEQLLAVFNSAHRVMKAESILKRAGFEILLIPAPRALATDCGLAIRYGSSIQSALFETLAAENLLPETIFRKEDETRYISVWPENDTKIP